MSKTTRQYEAVGADREFKLLVRKDPASGGLSVAASSSGAWASNISLGLNDDGEPCCTAVISLAPDTLDIVAAALTADGGLDGGDSAGEELAAPAKRVDDEPDGRASEHESKQQERRDEEPEGRPFDQIAKGAKEKAASAAKPSDAKPGSGKVVSKSSSGGRQTSRSVAGGQQALVRR